MSSLIIQIAMFCYSWKFGHYLCSLFFQFCVLTFLGRCDGFYCLSFHIHLEAEAALSALLCVLAPVASSAGLISPSVPFRGSALRFPLSWILSQLHFFCYDHNPQKKQHRAGPLIWLSLGLQPSAEGMRVDELFQHEFTPCTWSGKEELCWVCVCNSGCAAPVDSRHHAGLTLLLSFTAVLRAPTA